MTKSTAHSRRQRNPHTHDEQPDKTAFFSKASKEHVQQKTEQPFFQAKLAIGPANDQYEQEADNAAQAVVSNKNAKPVLQNQKVSSVQRLATPVEDEKLGTNDARMAKDKEIQEKPIQRTATDLEQERMKGTKKEEAPEKEEEKKKTPVQTKPNGTASNASPQVSSKIENTAGKGTALPKKTLQEMNTSFGADFSTVRIHHDSEAVAMNKELHAQAFTHGNDIYFNEGKFNPENAEGKFLLAHELTHVIQQGEEIHRKPASKKKKVVTTAPGFTGKDTGTFIERIDVSINFNGPSSITLNWKNPEATTDKQPDFILPTSFMTSPGAGQCNRNCGDVAESNLHDSNCTPLGSFMVQGFAPSLGDSAATVVTYYDQDRGIAFHYYDVPNFPQSHGCTRMDKAESGADWIQHNSIKGITTVTVNATGDATKREECYVGKKRMKMADYEKLSARERILQWFHFGMRRKDNADGNFYLKEAVTYANGLNDNDIARILKGKGKKELKAMYDAAVAADGVGPDSNLAQIIDKKLHPPAKKDK